MPKRVIIVDDSKTVVATAEMALEDSVTAGQITFKGYLNPVDLLSDLQSGAIDFDLLISDINMPQMNGLELTAHIKADARFKTKPILILTTESSADMKQKGKELGVTGWMVKPFSDDKLLKSVKMVLGI
jgi:two-component system chemotaxis response regulator CheY